MWSGSLPYFHLDNFSLLFVQTCNRVWWEINYFYWFVAQFNENGSWFEMNWKVGNRFKNWYVQWHCPFPDLMNDGSRLDLESEKFYQVDIWWEREDIFSSQTLFIFSIIKSEKLDHLIKGCSPHQRFKYSFRWMFGYAKKAAVYKCLVSFQNLQLHSFVFCITDHWLERCMD